MPRNPLEDAQGWQFVTPDEAREWLENQRLLTARERARVDGWIKQWETREGLKIVDRLKASAASIKEARDRNYQAMEDGARRAIDVKQLVKAGRMSPDEALREIARLNAQHAVCLRIQQSLQASVQQWEEDTTLTPSEAVERLGSRFAAARRPERLSLNYLRGDEPSQFTSPNRIDEGGELS